jgi:hypothetical protein
MEGTWFVGGADDASTLEKILLVAIPLL